MFKKTWLILVMVTIAFGSATVLMVNASDESVDPVRVQDRIPNSDVEADDLLVFEGDLSNVDIEAWLVNAIPEINSTEIEELESLILETAYRTSTTWILNQPLHLAMFLGGRIGADGDVILLGQNIDMGAVGSFPGRAYFSGAFNGLDFTISNLTIEGESLQVAIGFINIATYMNILNVTFEDLIVDSNPAIGVAYTGGLIGYLGSEPLMSTIENVHITGDSLVSEGMVGTGGFVGYIYGSGVEIISSTNEATVTTIRWGIDTGIGGFVGITSQSNLYIYNSINAGTIFTNGNTQMGGLLGRAFAGANNYTLYNTIRISDSANTGSVSTNGGRSGGMIGHLQDYVYYGLNVLIYNSTNEGDVFSPGATGGIIGAYTLLNRNSSSMVIDTTYNTGEIGVGMTGTTANAGGIIGSITSSSAPTRFVNVSNYGDVTSTSRSGGIVGDIANSDNISMSVVRNDGTIFSNTIAGGILGLASGSTYVVINSWINNGLIGGAIAGNVVGYIEAPAVVIY